MARYAVLHDISGDDSRPAGLAVEMVDLVLVHALPGGRSTRHRPDQAVPAAPGASTGLTRRKSGEPARPVVVRHPFSEVLGWRARLDSRRARRHPPLRRPRGSLP